MSRKSAGSSNAYLPSLLGRVRRRWQSSDLRDSVKAFTFATSSSLVVSGMTREWRGNTWMSSSGVQIRVASFTLFACAVVAFWVFGLMRLFRKSGWARWIVLPYVLLILCPAEWLASRRMEPGGDFMMLFVLQLPVVIACSIRRIRNRRDRSGRKDRSIHS